MSRQRRKPDPDPIEGRIDRLRAVWAIIPPESRETFLAKLDEVGRAWTGYCWQPEYAPSDLPGHPIAWADLVPYERDQGGYWLYGTDPYGADKRWVPVKRPHEEWGGCAGGHCWCGAQHTGADLGQEMTSWRP